MTPRSHHAREVTDARVIVRLRARYPRYRWRYRMRRSLDAVWPTYEAIGAHRMRTVTRFSVDGQSAWRWTDSRELAL